MTTTARRLRRLGVSSVAAAAVVALSSCASPVSDDGDDPADGGDQTLTVTAFDEVDVTVLNKVADDFEADNEGWTVEVTQIPQDNYVTKLQLSVEAGAPPDIAYVYAIGEIANFQPLDELLYQAHDLDPADFNEATLEYSCGWEDQLYCIGGYGGSVVLFYNKAIFDELGVDYPSATTPMTFDEYAALAAELTTTADDGTVVWGGFAREPTYYVDPGILLDDTGKTVELTDPDYVQTWTALTNMVLDGNAPSEADLSASTAKDVFAAGGMAMLISDNFAIDMMEENGIEWGVAPTPVQPGQEPWVNVWTNAYGVPQGAAHPEEAAEFLALLATNGQQYEADESLIPLNLEQAQELFGSKSDDHAQFVEVAALARTGTFTPNLYNWLDPIKDAWTATTSGQKTVEEALAEAEPKAQQGVDTTWRIWDSTVGAE